MAGPITWKNVTPIDQSGEVNAYLRAGQQLGQGIAGIDSIAMALVSRGSTATYPRLNELMFFKCK